MKQPRGVCTIGSATNYIVCAYWRYCSFYQRREEVYKLSLLRSMDHMKWAAVLWSPRSPDLTPANVCLRSHLDGKVYSKLINMFNERCRLIKTAETTVWYITGYFSVSAMY